jgi:hypothetical protein
VSHKAYQLTVGDPAMPTWESQMRAAATRQRQREREAVKQQRELERREKDRAKLDAIEQARLKVEAFENRMELLLSIHKDCANAWDWAASAAALPVRTLVSQLRK